MQIITLEGLPLVGKTETGKRLCEYLNSKGIKSLYRHAQITDSEAANRCIIKAFQCLEKWNYSNNQAVFDFIKYRYEQIYIDFNEFYNTRNQFSDIEYLILDRYITGHDIMANFFGYGSPDITIDEFYKMLPKEIVLTCDFAERKRRSLQRQKTNNITKYTLEDYSIHNLMQMNYCCYFQDRDRCKIIPNNSYISPEELALQIEKL